MIVPVLATHQHRHDKAQGHGQCGSGHAVGFLQQLFKPVLKRQDTQSDPEAEYIEGTRVRVVALAHLIRRLVQVDYDGQAGKQEKQACDPAVARVVAELEEEADQAEEQGQEEIVVLAPVVDDEVRTLALVAQPQPVEEADATLPIAFGQVAGILATMQVVLPAHEIPQEIADIHLIDLIVEEEIQVFGHPRLLEVDTPAVDGGPAGFGLGDVTLVDVFALV